MRDIGRQLGEAGCGSIPLGEHSFFCQPVFQIRCKMSVMVQITDPLMLIRKCTL